MTPSNEQRLRELIEVALQGAYRAGAAWEMTSPQLKEPREAIVSFVRELTAKLATYEAATAQANEINNKNQP